MPWRYRLLLLAILAGLGIPAYLVWQRERNTKREQQIAETWRRFDWAVAAGDPIAAEELLAHLANLTHHEPAVERRLEALHRGDSDPEDLPIAWLLVTKHLRHDRWPEAAREAAKVIAMAPGDMLARGVLARQAMQAGRDDEARRHLGAIAPPHDAPDAAAPGALLLAISLKRELGDDDSDFLSFIAVKIAPLLKSRQVDRLPPLARLQLAQCYHLACDALDKYPELAAYWAPVARLISELGDDAVRPSAIALTLERHLALIDQMRKMNRLSPTESAGLMAGFARQVRDTWAAANITDPGDPLPYAGLALACRRAGEPQESTRWLERGLTACADSRGLYLIAGRLLRQSDPLAGAEFLERGLKRFPHDAAIEQAFAELAAAAGRRDRALDACRAARAEHPNRTWACRLEASICLDLGRPTRALEALAPIKADLPSDAGGMELYVRAACAVGAETSAHELLAREPGDAAEAAGYAGAARGYLLAGRGDDAIRLARRIIDRYPEHLAARLVLAEALRLRAEAGDLVHLPVDRVREAIEAFDWLRRRDPANCVIAQRIAWLQLKGLEAADLALKSAAPLREQAVIARLTPEMNETLGATLLAAGQIDAALPPLTAAIESAPDRAGPYISRAAALLRLGRKREARADLDRAENLSRTPRQTAEWQQVLRKLRGDS